jgi:formylglycine-generating enzyme required for sulfatase activity
MIAVAFALAWVNAGCTRSPRAATGPEGGTPEIAVVPKEINVEKDGSVMLLVPGGRFEMGSPDEAKSVSVQPFYMDRLEVTNEQYAKFLAEAKAKGDAAWRHPDQPKSKANHEPATWGKPEFAAFNDPKHPVVGVDWFDATAYAQWAGKRLPTEAEWECAARGTDARLYPWGNTPPEERMRYKANYFGSFLAADGYRFTAPAGKFPEDASPAGCLDMAGNASEWVADWFAPLPGERRLRDPKGPATGTERVIKGGAWEFPEAALRTFHRLRMEPSERRTSVGFRCARDAAPPK